MKHSDEYATSTN